MKKLRYSSKGVALRHKLRLRESPTLPQFTFYRSHFRIAYATWDDLAEHREVGGEIESKAMRGDPAAHVDANGRDLSELPVVGVNPHTRTAKTTHRREFPRVAYELDKRLLERANI